ncbi:MAG: M48 family metalloprotease [Thermoguttaceae bacterium]
MAIAVTCSKCRASFRVKDELAGRRGKCPKCQELLTVPAAAPTPTAAVKPGVVETQPSGSSPGISPGSVLAAFHGKIEPVPSTWTYRLGLLLVGLVMVLLPLVYLGVICLVAWAMYLHATHDTWIMTASRNPRIELMAVIIYLGPLVAGGIAIVFMVKPFFARPADAGRRRSLTRSGEPLLFALVDRICDTVGSPRPKRIDVDCQVNASASLRRGIWSIFAGNDLVLTIGLPLAAAMNAEQFVGVLAHEFGHFSQGVAMRMTFLIRAISFWFTRVVYERDEWDVQLVVWCNKLDLRIGAVLWLARAMVWCTRRILWVLMMVGHAVGGYMLRQMEFDADHCEMRLCGSAVFEQSQRLLPALGIACQGALSTLAEYRREGRLGDNLPRLASENVARMTSDVRQEIDKLIEKSKTGLFDTHPSDRDRILAARRENAPGVFHAEQPAAAIFVHFDELCRNVTWDYYRGLFGPNLKPSDMHPIDELLARQSGDAEGQKALARYFQGTFTALRVPLLSAKPLNQDEIDPKKMVLGLRQAREKMLELAGSARDTLKRYDQQDTQLRDTFQAAAMFEAGIRFKPDMFSIRPANTNEANELAATLRMRQQDLGCQLDEFEKVVGRRLGAALALLSIPKVARQIEDGPARLAEAKRSLPVIGLFRSVLPQILELRDARAAMMTLLAQIEKNQKNEWLPRTIGKRMTTMAEQIRGLSERLSTYRYPLEHGRGDVSVAEYAADRAPLADDLPGIVEVSGQMLENLASLFVRMFSRLILTAEAVESLAGLPPLPELVENKP